MAALGKDIGGIGDLDSFLSFVDGPQAAGERVMCSLMHSPGVIWWAPDRGTNLLDFLHRDASAEEMQMAIEGEIAKEEAVETSVVSVVKFGSEAQIRIELSLTQDEGKVTLTLAVDKVAGVLAAAVEV